MEAIGKDLVEFWDFAAGKGLVNKDWANTLKTAVKQVLVTVEPESWESLDLSNLDLDAFVARFERLRMGDLKPASLAVYGQRVRLALTAYMEFLRSPSTWQYPSVAKESANGAGERRRPAKQPGTSGKTNTGRKASPLPAAETVTNANHVDLLSYPYPLRPGMVITLTLPVDLTKHEAKRLAAYVDSLALEPQLALPAGSMAMDEVL